MKTSKVQNSRNAMNRQPYFPSLLTVPIPDGKKFAPNHHLVSDISLLSEAEPSNNQGKLPPTNVLQNKPKFSNLPADKKASQHVDGKSHHQSSSHKLAPKEKTLIRLRRKYGLPISDSLDYNLYSCISSESSDSESVSNREEELQRQQKQQRKSSKKSTNSVLRDTPLSESIAGLKKKQAQLKAQFEKLKLENLTSQCPEETSRQTIPKKLITNDNEHNIDKNKNRKGDTSIVSLQSNGTDVQMLEFIKKQEEQLQLISKQMEELLNLHKASNNPCESLSSTKSQTSESTNPFQQKENKENIPESPKYKNIQTMTSFVEDHNKSLDYLDTSIEKVREDMRKDFDNANSTPISQKMNSMFVEPGTIYHTPDDKLNVNSSVSTCSNKHRSSVSVDSPDKGPYFRTSSPKGHSRKTEYPQTNPFSVPGKQTLTRVYHSEQSFYVQQLASKYDLQDDNTIDLTKYKQLPGPSRECFYERRECQTIPKSLWNDSINNDNDLQRYSISDMNTSVATKKYLEKYGLLDDQSNLKKTRRKASDYYNNRDVICEENENSLVDDCLSVDRNNDNDRHQHNGHHNHRSNHHTHRRR